MWTPINIWYHGVNCQFNLLWLRNWQNIAKFKRIMGQKSEYVQISIVILVHDMCELPGRWSRYHRRGLSLWPPAARARTSTGRCSAGTEGSRRTRHRGTLVWKWNRFSHNQVNIMMVDYILWPLISIFHFHCLLLQLPIGHNSYTWWNFLTSQQNQAE